MDMHNPPHPGELVREECLVPLGLSVTTAARALGINRKALSEVISGQCGISAEMAIRLSRVFGSEPETWLRMQMEYDLWHAAKRESRFKLKRLYVGERKASTQSLFGTNPGSVWIRRGADLTRPILNDRMDADSGREIRR
jgi:addiction module HigA family antidote